MRPLFRDFFFFNDTATTEIYTLSLHDALPIYVPAVLRLYRPARVFPRFERDQRAGELRHHAIGRSEEHTSELQSQSNLVCRLLLAQKNSTSKSDLRVENCELNTVTITLLTLQP